MPSRKPVDYFGFSLLLLVALSLGSCDAFKLLNEAEYEEAAMGPVSYLQDGFELNDGTMSTKYAYRTGKINSSWLQNYSDRPTEISEEWAYSGDYSVHFGNTFVQIRVSLPVEASLSYVINNNSSYPPNSSLIGTIDGEAYDNTKASYSRVSDSVWRANCIIPPGTYTIELRDSGYMGFCYVDDLQIGTGIDLTGSTPVSGSGLEAGSIAFDWPDAPGASSYTLQISTDPLFRTVLQEKAGLTQSASSLDLAIDSRQLYWRIGALGLYRGDMIWSEAQLLRVIAYEAPVNCDFEVDSDISSWYYYDCTGLLASWYSHTGNYSLGITPKGEKGVKISRYFEVSVKQLLTLWVYAENKVVSASVDGVVSFSQNVYYSWTPISLVLEPGKHWVEINTTGTGTIRLDTLTFNSVTPLPFSDGFEAAVLSPTWTIQNPSVAPSATANRTGAQSLRFAKTIGSAPELTCSYTSLSPVTMSFWLKLDSGADDMYITVDGTQKLAAYPIAWQQFFVSLPAGNHTISFRYATSVPTRYAYIDDVLIN